MQVYADVNAQHPYPCFCGLCAPDLQEAFAQLSRDYKESNGDARALAEAAEADRKRTTDSRLLAELDPVGA